jgi:hypothetical protein
VAPTKNSPSKDFFLWDYDSTLFPLRINRLMVDKFSSELARFVKTQSLSESGGFQPQHRVFATKRGWFLRPTVKLDPVAEFFFYDFVYRNRQLFRNRSRNQERATYGYQFLEGNPISILKSYSDFKKAVAKFRHSYKHCIYFDVSAYFNRIYHHDLIEWCEKVGASQADVSVFGKFLREISAGRSIDCLPQGIYPAKMVGSAFLNFLEESGQIRSAQTVRMMDDVWLFDNDREKLIADFLMAQKLLVKRSLTINEEKSAVLEGHDPSADLPPDLDEMKIQLLQKRREELAEGSEYTDPVDDDSEDTELIELTNDEQNYLVSLLKRGSIQEEDAELVLTLMRDHSSSILEFIPQFIAGFPGLAKRLYYFCINTPYKSEIAAEVLKFLKTKAQITEYQLFWFGMMTESYFLNIPACKDLLLTIYDHPNGTDITRAKILEIPEKRFGFDDLREGQLNKGHSDWLAWTAAVGARDQPKGHRNQLLKYFRKVSPMNHLIGEFVEECF